MKNFLRLSWRYLSRASLLVPFLLLSPLLTPNARAVSIQMSGTRSVVSGTDCGIATYRFGTNSTFNGKQLDLLVEVLSEDNEYQGGQCIDASSNVLSARLRDNDASDDVAYMDLKITVVERNTTTPVEVDRLTITGFDLDTNGPTTGATSTSTDDIYLKSPDGVYVSSSSLVQYSESSFFSGQYQGKLKGRSDANCNDGPGASVDITCRGGAIYINGGNGVNKVSSVNVRLQNDNAYGQQSGSETASHRLLQLSFEISEFDELVTNNSDYGDTPNSYGSTGHSVGSNIALGYGLVPDNEAAQQASTNADSDDNDGTGSAIKYDDEEGVKYNGQALNGQTLSADSTSNLDITTFGTGYLSGWIDLNRDGDFSDAGEKVISDRSITSTTVSTTSVPITIPNTASGGTSYMRFRFTTTTGVAVSGYSNSDGEVEDYQITIAPATTTISGTLYEDTDGGDDFDNGETTLPANINVKLLDSNNNVVATTTTAANGTYTFTNVTNGNYKIQVDTSDTDIPSGYTLGTANDLAVTVAGSPVTGQNFGFDKPPATVTISGKVWNDANGSANNTFTNINTGNEIGTNAGGLFAILVDSSGNVVASTAINADGTYTFTNIAANQNNLTIRLSTTAGTVNSPAPINSLPTNWQNTTPLTSTAFNIGSSNISNQDFGIRTKNPDLSGNFCQASSDLMFILDDSSSVDATEVQQQRDAVMAMLNHLVNNNISARVAIVGFDSGKRTIIDYTNVTAANLSTFQTALNTNYGVPGSGTNWPSGFQQAELLGLSPGQPDVVFFFSDGLSYGGGNPIIEADKFKLAGAHIYGIWIDSDQNLTLNEFKEITDGEETTEFTGNNAAAAADYIKVANYGQLPPKVTALIEGICPPAPTFNISGSLYEDTDGGDDFDSGETTLPANITVKLLDSNNNIVATTTTDSNGNYTFTEVSDGNYKIQVDTSDTDIPAGYTLGTPNNLAVTVSGSSITNQNFGFDQPIPSNPNVLLVKRITAINGSSFTDLIDGVNDSNSPNYVPAPHDTDDNNANWPSNYLQGLLNGGTVRPNDEVEYTIYFLSAGDATAPKVLMCDRVPNNVTFIPTAFNSFATKNSAGLEKADRGIIWQYNGNTESLSNIKDGDVAQYFPPGEDPTDVYPTVDCGGENTNGAIVVNLGDLTNATAPGTPNDSYGFIRFRGRVK